MADKIPSMPIYPADFFGDWRVQELTITEQGLYLLLLAKAWHRPRCSLPAEFRDLKRVLFGTQKVPQKVSKVAERFFPVNEEGERQNPRQFREWQKLMESRRKRQEAANKRWSACNAYASSSLISHRSVKTSTTTTPRPEVLSTTRAAALGGGGSFPKKVPEPEPEPDAEIDHPVAQLQFLLGVAGADCEQAWRAHGHTLEDVAAWLEFREALTDANLSWCRSPRRYVAVQATRHRRPEDCDAWGSVHAPPEPVTRYHPYKKHTTVVCDGEEWVVGCENYARRPENHPEFARETSEGLLCSDGTTKFGVRENGR